MQQLLPGLEELVSEGSLPQQPRPIISMTLVEIFCPAWHEEGLDPDAASPGSDKLPIPLGIRRTFPDKLHWYEAGGSGTCIIYACEFSRALKPEEMQALIQAKQQGVIWLYQVMTK
jgi:hypothetical protein